MEETINFIDAMKRLNEVLTGEMKLEPKRQFQLCLTFAIGLINHKEFHSREELIEFVKEEALYYYDEEKFNTIKHDDLIGSRTTVQ